MDGSVMKDVFEALLTRQSISPKYLVAPGPRPEELERAFATAMTAPDHGALKPWRFLVVEGAGLGKLGDLYAEGLKREKPEAGAEELEVARSKALRSPLLIVCAAVVREDHPKVPPVEQVVAAACATQNLLVAFHALGYGAMLVTGPRAYDPVVKEGLGLKPGDSIVAFMHVGTVSPERAAGRPKRAEAAHHVRSWPEGAA